MWFGAVSIFGFGGPKTLIFFLIYHFLHETPNSTVCARCKKTVHMLNTKCLTKFSLAWAGYNYKCIIYAKGLFFSIIPFAELATFFQLYTFFGTFPDKFSSFRLFNFSFCISLLITQISLKDCTTTTATTTQQQQLYQTSSTATINGTAGSGMTGSDILHKHSINSLLAEQNEIVNRGLASPIEGKRLGKGLNFFLKVFCYFFFFKLTVNMISVWVDRTFRSPHFLLLLYYFFYSSLIIHNVAFIYHHTWYCFSFGPVM